MFCHFCSYFHCLTPSSSNSFHSGLLLLCAYYSHVVPKGFFSFPASLSACSRPYIFIPQRESLSLCFCFSPTCRLLLITWCKACRGGSSAGPALVWGTSSVLRAWRLIFFSVFLSLSCFGCQTLVLYLWQLLESIDSSPQPFPVLPNECRLVLRTLAPKGFFALPSGVEGSYNYPSRSRWFVF